MRGIRQLPRRERVLSGGSSSHREVAITVPSNLCDERVSARRFLVRARQLSGCFVRGTPLLPKYHARCRQRVGRAGDDLNQTYHFQATASGARTVLELCIDVALLTSGDLQNAVEKFHGFTMAARFSSAYKLIKFYQEHPDLNAFRDYDLHKQLVFGPGHQEEMARASVTRRSGPSPKTISRPCSSGCARGGAPPPHVISTCNC